MNAMGTNLEPASRIASQLITRQMGAYGGVQPFLRNQIVRLRVLSTIGGLVAALTSPTVHAQPIGPCVQIRIACEQAGFVLGGAHQGNGLLVDCIRPIMQGMPQLRNASKPPPPIDPQLVAACKARNPIFGQPRGAGPGPVGQPRGPVQALSAEPSQASPPAQPPDGGQPTLPTQPQAADPRSPCGPEPTSPPSQ
jgi:hypothetical protein